MNGFRHQNERPEKMDQFLENELLHKKKENISKSQFLNTKWFIMLLGFFLVAELNAGEVYFRADGQSSPYALKGAANIDGGVLKLDGINSYAQMSDSNKTGFGKDGLSICTVVKLLDSGMKHGSPDSHDMFVWKDKEFLLGRVGLQLYFNFYDGKDWKAMTLGRQLPLKEWIAVAAVARRVDDTAQGFNGYEIDLYIDGRLALTKRFDRVFPAVSDKPVEIGNGWGGPWFMNGEVSEVAVYDRPLSSAEITAGMRSNLLVAGKCPDIEPCLSPGISTQFDAYAKLAAMLPGNQRGNALRLVAAVKALASQPGFGNEAQNLIQKLKQSLDSQNISLASFDNRLMFIQNERMGLCVFSDSKAKQAGLLDIYDLGLERSVLATPLSWNLNFIGLKNSITPFSEGVHSEAVVSSRGATLKWYGEKASPFCAQVDLELLEGSRLEMSFNVKNNGSTTMGEVKFPALKLAQLTKGDDRVFVPMMEGEVHKNPINGLYSYDRWYPCGGVSMQFTAYYDEAGGLYIASEDPLARTKNYQISGSDGKLSIGCNWPSGGNTFNTNGKIVLEFFNGDWYDAAQIYKRWLPTAKWWIPLPRKDTPAWYKDNSLCFRGSFDDLLYSQIVDVQKYFEIPVTLHAYVWQDRPHDVGYPRAIPKREDIKSFLTALPKEIRVKAYVNNRVWEIAQTEPGFEYQGKGSLYAVKKNDGGIYTETYNNRIFATMCPAVKEWQELEKKIFLRVASYGFAGLYLDQTAAGAPKQCFDKNHGHTANGGDVWLEKGYWQMLLPLRSELKKKYPEIALESEDLCEAYMNIFDGFLPWRAYLFNEPVPAFQAVYGGRIQHVGYNYGGEQNGAEYAKVAKQFLTGEQIGWFTIRPFGNPFFNEFGLFIKRLVHLRLALLPFFNDGEMSRPLTWKTPMKRQSADWGYYGPRIIESDTVAHSVWRHKNQAVLLFVNTTSESALVEPVVDGVRLGLGNGQLMLNAFSLEVGIAVEERQNHFSRKLELPPHSMAVWIVTAKDSSTAETEKVFSALKQKIEVIKTFKAWPSPDYTSVQTLEVGKWNEAIKAPLYFGMRPNNKTEENNCFTSISDKSLIYLGQAAMDSASTLELQVAINKDLAGGTVELRLDSPDGTPIAMVSLAQPTEGWTDFAVRAAPIKTGLSGIHKLFLVFQTAKGSGACNFKAWRFNFNLKKDK